jgi:Putative transposase
VLSRAFRRLFLQKLTAAYDAGELQFWRELVALKEPKAFAATLAQLRTTERVVYAKKAFSDPKQVLRYLSRYTHRVAITNNRLVDIDDTHVRFCWKDYQDSGGHKDKVVRLEIAEFIRRFLLHVLPHGFQRIRHYGFLANGHRAEKLALCRSLLNASSSPTNDHDNLEDKHLGRPNQESPPCPCCGGRMKIIETFDGSVLRPYEVRRPDAL